MSLDRNFVLGLKRSGKYACPDCQHTRTKNKRDTPLSVTVKSDCVVYYCHHCNTAKGVEYYEENKRQYTKIHKEKRNIRTDIKKLEVRKRHGTVW